MTMPAALAEAGVTDADYELVEQARALADVVNRNLAARGATVRFALTCHPVTPATTTWDADVTVVSLRG